MKASQNAIDLIKEFEGFSSNVYRCQAGKKTIGYGHLLQKGENFSQIDQLTAENLLIQDIETAEHSVLRSILAPLNQNQFDALVSFTFNVGGGALQRSTLRQKINRMEHNQVDHELKRWIYADGKKQLGLILRREAEAELYFA